MDGLINSCMDRQKEERKEGQTNRDKDRQKAGKKEGQMEGRKERRRMTGKQRYGQIGEREKRKKAQRSTVNYQQLIGI